MRKIKPWLKWPGAKYHILNRLEAVLPSRSQFFDVFAGGGSVFLNTIAPCQVNDANADLILAWTSLQRLGAKFIEQCSELFTPDTDTEAVYIARRREFNQGGDALTRAALFVYLNRHCFNGLCRYNRDGAFNASYAHNTPKHFPAAEMTACLPRLAHCTFTAYDFRDIIPELGDGDVAYCDPPYVPVSATSDFNRYYPGHFSLADHHALAEQAAAAAQRGAYVVISNQYSATTCDIYRAWSVERVQAPRRISCKADTRTLADEAFFIYGRDSPLISFTSSENYVAPLQLAVVDEGHHSSPMDTTS